MSVVLYRQGATHKINGIKCEMKVFSEFSFIHMLDDGWFLSPEEVYKEAEEVVEEVSKEIPKEVVDITAGLKNKEIRKVAEKLGVKNFKTTRINKLREAVNDAQG